MSALGNWTGWPSAGLRGLLEDLTNLFANEWFGVEGAGGEPDGAAKRVLAGLEALKNRAALTVVVGNDLFSDGMHYDRETLSYLTALANLNCAAAAMADSVYEVVCGIPIHHKGGPHQSKGAVSR